MTTVTGPTTMHRGQDYPVSVTIKRVGGARRIVHFKVHAPFGMTAGRRALVLTGTPSDAAGGGTVSALLSSLFGGDGGTFDESGPKSLSSLARQVAALHRFDGITASFRPRPKRGDDVGQATSDDSLPSGAEGKALRERRVYRDPRLRLSGTVWIPVVVR
jgi:hypothetical protein